MWWNKILIDTNSIEKWLTSPSFFIPIEQGIMLVILAVSVIMQIILPTVSGYGYRVWNILLLVFTLTISIVYWHYASNTNLEDIPTTYLNQGDRAVVTIDRITKYTYSFEDSAWHSEDGKHVVFPDSAGKKDEGYDPKTGVFTAPKSGHYLIGTESKDEQK